MKECAEDLAPILHQIYRSSLDETEVPCLWKEAEVVPIHKSGSKAVMANFRPVALTSIACKVFEKILCAAILAFLTANNLITQQQHGFVRGRSCQINILLCLGLAYSMAGRQEAKSCCRKCQIELAPSGEWHHSRDGAWVSSIFSRVSATL